MPGVKVPREMNFLLLPRKRNHQSTDERRLAQLSVRRKIESPQRHFAAASQLQAVREETQASDAQPQRPASAAAAAPPTVAAWPSRAGDRAAGRGRRGGRLELGRRKGQLGLPDLPRTGAPPATGTAPTAAALAPTATTAAAAAGQGRSAG